MEKQFLGIITLIRSALKDEPCTIPVGFDWEEAVDTIYEHHLVALAVRGASRCGVL